MAKTNQSIGLYIKQPYTYSLWTQDRDVSTIELITVEKRYGNELAVAPTSLRIEQGELVTLLGPSGSGKSTILAMIAGITPLSRGQIRIGERDVTHVPSAQRNLGMMFQSYALFPHLSVFDNVAFPLRIRGVPAPQIRTRVTRALEQVQLAHTLHTRRPNELSGGQQQRVALARALVFNPDILLLDEPMGALDKKLREEVQLEIKQLQQTLGITTLMVTHDQEEALSMSTRVVVLEKGKVQQEATPAQIYREPVNRFVAEFMGTANLFRGDIHAMDGQAMVRIDTGEHIPCSTACHRTGRVQIMVRPEHLRLHAQAAPARLPARVASRIYLGQTTRVHLHTAAGHPLVAVVAHDVALADGQTVYVDWAAEHSWCMSA